jgi:hypothetical protein
VVQKSEKEDAGNERDGPEQKRIWSQSDREKRESNAGKTSQDPQQAAKMGGRGVSIKDHEA